MNLGIPLTAMGCLNGPRDGCLLGWVVAYRIYRIPKLCLSSQPITLWQTNSLLLKMAIKIVDLPIENCDFP